MALSPRSLKQDLGHPSVTDLRTGLLPTLFQSFEVNNRPGVVVFNPCIWNNVCLESDSLFRKLSCFVCGDSFEVSPEVIVQRFFRLELDHFHQP
jgi:hypothetical protein